MMNVQAVAALVRIGFSCLPISFAIMATAAIAQAPGRCVAGLDQRVFIGRLLDEAGGSDVVRSISFAGHDFLADGEYRIRSLPWRTNECIFLGAGGQTADTRVRKVSVSGTIRDGVKWRVKLEVEDPVPRSRELEAAYPPAVLVSSRSIPSQNWRARRTGDVQRTVFQVEAGPKRRLRMECTYDESAEPDSSFIVRGYVEVNADGVAKGAMPPSQRFASCPLPFVDLDGDGVPEVLVIENYNDYVLYSMWPGRPRKLALGASGV